LKSELEVSLRWDILWIFSPGEFSPQIIYALTFKKIFAKFDKTISFFSVNRLT